MRENKVKRALRQGGVALGTLVFEFNTTGIARIAAGAGADFVLFDMEHTGWSLETVRSLMATSRAADLVPMVRVPVTHYHFLAHALDVVPSRIVLVRAGHRRGSSRLSAPGGRGASRGTRDR